MKSLFLSLTLGAAATLNVAAQTSASGGTTSTSSGTQTTEHASPGLGSGATGKAAAIYISGKVVMQDGSAVPPNLAIQRVCGGISKTVSYADSGGRFGFQWRDSGTTVIDVSDSGSVPNRNSSSGGFGGSQSAGGTNSLAADPFATRMMNCELRASAPGYTSGAISLFDRAGGDNPDVGMIILRPAGMGESSVSVTSMRAPNDARRAFERGVQSLRKNKPTDAAKEFEKAVAIYPGYADAWMSLAKVRLAQKSPEPARLALTKAMESDPRLIEPYLELGLLAAKDSNWRESARYLDRALELDGVDYPQAWYADAVANYNLGKYDAAEKSAREAVKLDPKHANPRSDYLLGMILAEKKDYANAALELTTFIRLSPGAPDLAQVKSQLEQFESLKTRP